MQDNKPLNYIFTRYIHQTMINEKLNYVRNVNKKSISVIHNENLLNNVQYPKEQLLESLPKEGYKRLEEYVDDYILSDSISKLSEREKYIIYKRYVEGKKDPAIAKKLKVSSQAVSKSRRKALKKIHDYFSMKG